MLAKTHRDDDGASTFDRASVSLGLREAFDGLIQVPVGIDKRVGERARLDALIADPIDLVIDFAADDGGGIRCAATNAAMCGLVRKEEKRR